MWKRVVALVVVARFGCGGITLQNDPEVEGAYTTVHAR